MHFYKYQGTGNDFIMIDDRAGHFDITDTALVKQWCDRRFGIGADGLILLRNCADAHFEMIYFNSDGNLSTMCGNGGRCIARFAQQLKVIENHCSFRAVDGMHQATLDTELVSLKMNDVDLIQQFEDFYYLDTGSPHVVKHVPGLHQLNVFEEGRKIRYSERFKAVGTNVNFIVEFPDRLGIRTYERGVENETLSCGTGITAAAIAQAYHLKKPAGNHSTWLEAEGGNLKVTFDYDGEHTFTNVHLIGPAEFVFEGEVRYASV